MNKFFKRVWEVITNETETVIGGVFGLVAIIAIICEMNISNFDNASIAGGIKDIFSTLIVVVLLAKILKDFLKKSDFRSCFDSSMEQLCVKYKPLISKEIAPQKQETDVAKSKIKHLENFICYEIANNVNVLFGNKKEGTHRFLEIDNSQSTTVLKLLVRTTFLSKVLSETNTVKCVADKIKQSLISSYHAYNITTQPAGKNTNIVIEFDKLLRDEKDAIEAINLIDKAIFLYILEAREK